MIKHITQDTNECVLACIAMVCNLDYETIKQAYKEFTGEGITKQEVRVILDRLQYNYIEYVDPIIYSNRLYIITVPSLNIIARNHCIVVDTREVETKIYDPAKGYLNSKYYSSVEDVQSYSEVVEIVL